jgi:elongation factor P hydroxylase
MEDNLITWLQNWFQSNCNSDWEHGSAITIQSLDNPGWSICIDLESTDMENENFESIAIERTEDDWIHCKVEGFFFKGACGSLNLSEVLEIFQTWVISRQD